MILFVQGDTWEHEATQVWAALKAGVKHPSWLWGWNPRRSLFISTSKDGDRPELKCRLKVRCVQKGFVEGGWRSRWEVPLWEVAGLSCSFLSILSGPAAAGAGCGVGAGAWCRWLVPFYHAQYFYFKLQQSSPVVQEEPDQRSGQRHWSRTGPPSCAGANLPSWGCFQDLLSRAAELSFRVSTADLDLHWNESVTSSNKDEQTRRWQASAAKSPKMDHSWAQLKTALQRCRLWVIMKSRWGHLPS